MSTTIVETSQLEIVCQRVIQKLKDLEIQEIELRHDMYWELTSQQAYEMKFVIDQPNVGSLVDDWAELKKVGTNEHPTTFVDFDRLASILKAISEELNPEQ